ncbi:hypothetical protein BDZ89DRAFT_1140296 [Hymenopellis radicata]|nr:hypothetical protein BDZ89DRAFT_1140296 [Hymenopellis radicata]
MAPDKILPIPLMEQSNPVYDLLIDSCLIVSGQIQPNVLRDALTELVNRWPILGSRVARNRKNRFELHLPDKFSDARPPFVFSEAHSDIAYPSMPSRKAHISPQMSTILDHFRTPSTPRIVPDLLKRKDAPMLQVHVHCFADVTCIGFHIPHLFCDVPGLAIILRAWCSLIASPNDMHSVVLPQLVEGDPLKDFGEPYPKTKAELKVFRKSMLSTFTIWGLFDTVKYYARLVSDVVTNNEECRLLFIPESVIAQLREETMGGKEQWVSENDIVTALLAKLHLFNREPTKQPFTLAFTANLRGQIPALSGPNVYIRNSLIPLCAPAVPIREMQSMSVSEIALDIRRTIEAQRTTDQLSKTVTVYREMCRQRKLPSYHPADETNFYVTSWAAGKWGELDFSGALTEGAGQRNPKAGRVLFAGGASTNPSYGGRSRWSIVMSKVAGDDEEEAGYWCELGARLSAWPELEKYVSAWSA